MIKIKTLCIILVVLFFLSFRSFSQHIILEQKNITGIYKTGEKIEFYLLSDVTVSDSILITVIKNNRVEIEKNKIVIDSEKQLVYSGSFETPCSVMLTARFKDHVVSLGSMVDPHLIRPGAKAPKDFKAYWKQQKKLLNALNWEVKSKPVLNEAIPEAFSCEDIELSCLGPKPARGYYVKPAGANPKSLPAVLLVHAAGVSGSWCRSEPSNAMRYAKMGAICFDLNAHGMLNGQSEEYYDQLEKGELKGYWTQGINSRNDYYFRGMYLRLLRTIEFLSRQPEWDGRRILVIGESQGGGQALAAAGLDHRVSAVVALVPAMCDWMATLTGLRGGWPQPFDSDESKEALMKTIPYFDAAYLLKGSVATIFTEIGYVDVTCPPASVYAAVNEAGGRTIIMGVPYRAHHQPPADTDLAKLWHETVYKPREQFINNYLK
jgi:cephalosporin-C deacetylase